MVGGFGFRYGGGHSVVWLVRSVGGRSVVGRRLPAVVGRGLGRTGSFRRSVMFRMVAVGIGTYGFVGFSGGWYGRRYGRMFGSVVVVVGSSVASFRLYGICHVVFLWWFVLWWVVGSVGLLVMGRYVRSVLVRSWYDTFGGIVLSVVLWV